MERPSASASRLSKSDRAPARATPRTELSPSERENSPRLLRPREVADFIGLPEPTLAQWRYLRVGPPFIKVGKHVRYRAVDVDAWLAQRTVTPEG